MVVAQQTASACVQEAARRQTVERLLDQVRLRDRAHAIDWREMRLEAGVVSYPMELFLPEPRAWAAEAADWSSAADGLP